MQKKGVLGLNSMINSLFITALVITMLGTIVTTAGSPDARDKTYMAKSTAIDGLNALYAVHPNADVTLRPPIPISFTDAKIIAADNLVQVMEPDSRPTPGKPSRHTYPYIANSNYNDIDEITYSNTLYFYKKGKEIGISMPDQEVLSPTCDDLFTAAEPKTVNIHIRTDDETDAAGDILKGFLRGSEFETDQGVLADLSVEFMQVEGASIKISPAGNSETDQRKARKLACLLTNEIDERSGYQSELADPDGECKSVCLTVQVPKDFKLDGIVYNSILQYYET
ncbi:MAG: hypothetical protein KKG59_01745 [Nanoarchaeota archaeon]|nr:hypothetical protein [Nanoarchaeota archaeon]